MLKMALLSSLVAAAPLQALTLTEMSASIDACHMPYADVDDTVSALAQQGWVLAPEGELSPEIIELLIWPQVAFYATGDTGGAQIKSIVELQRKTVAGFAKKKDIPQSKTRILTRQIGADAEAALVFWLQPDPAQIQIICRFALSPASMDSSPSDDFAVVPPAVFGRTQTLIITPMNAASLSTKINAPVTVSGTMQTQNIFPSGSN